jgi:glycosyltransferase involved in cell wall biosynthesis
MGPFRIALLLPHLGVYGGIRRFLELGRVWCARGNEVVILTPGGPDRDQPWVPFGGRVGSLEELPDLRWDLVLSPDPGLFKSAEAPGALFVFYSVLEGAPRERDAWRRADLVLANSKGMLRYLRRHRVHAVNAAGGVNADFFRPPAHGSRADRVITGGPVRVLVYGRLSRKRKGTRIAVLAVDAAARAAGVSTELILFDSPPRPDFEEAPADSPTLDGIVSIPHRWVLGPTQEDLRALYGDADLFVSAERRAGWSNTSAEAMACGAAVVCTRSGTEDFAHDRDTAAVTRWPWVWSLSRKIIPLLRDSANRAIVAGRGRRRIVEFTWERTADRIESAIDSCLGRRRHGGAK